MKIRKLLYAMTGLLAATALCAAGRLSDMVYRDIVLGLMTLFAIANGAVHILKPKGGQDAT